MNSCCTTHRNSCGQLILVKTCSHLCASHAVSNASSAARRPAPTLLPVLLAVKAEGGSAGPRCSCFPPTPSHWHDRRSNVDATLPIPCKLERVAIWLERCLMSTADSCHT